MAQPGATSRGRSSGLGAQQKNRRRALGEVEVVTHPDGPLVGAIGAALLGAYRYQELEERGQSPTAMAAAPA